MADTKDEVKTGELVRSDSPTELAEQLPSFIEVGDRSGMETLTKEDISLPRIGLAQQMSPELVDGDPKRIEGLRIGNMFNTLTQQVYGDGPLQFSVIRMDPPRWVEFIPREQGGGVRDPNVPPGDPRTEFQADGKPPVATKFYDFIVMLWPTRELVALSFKSTGLKVAKQLNGLIAMRNHPIYAGKYALNTVMTQNQKGRFAIFAVKNAGVIPVEADYLAAKAAFNNMRNTVVKIDREGADTPDPDTFDAVALERESVAAHASDVRGM